MGMMRWVGERLKHRVVKRIDKVLYLVIILRLALSVRA